MSDIHGEGYGSSHDWGRGWTNNQPRDSYDKFTNYDCRNCKAFFQHRYDIQRNIFTALEESGVLDQCPGKSQ